MKKLILLAVFVIGAGFTTQAQEISENALGLRFGGASGIGAEISYQRALGMNNRLEVDLGWRNDSNFDAYKITGLYQWLWNLEGGFNWYAGAGAGLGSVSVNDPNDNEGVFIFVAGNLGIEYNFDIPLLVSLDIRPEIGLSGYDVMDGFSPDVALSLRYQF